MRFFLRALLFIGVLAAALALAEISMSVFRLGGTTVLDKFNHPFTYVPKSVKINALEGYGERKANSYGFLDRDYNLKDTTPLRCLLFGNSFTEAEQVGNEDVYDNLLEDKLSAHGRKTEIWNVGWSGNHLVEFIARYQHLAPAVPAKYVIIQMNPADIIHPDKAAVKYSLKNDSFSASFGIGDKPGKIDKVNMTLRRHSAFWENMVLRLYLFKKYLQGGGQKINPEANNDEEADVSKKTANLDPKSLQKLEDLLSVFRKMTAEHHARLIIFTFPISTNPDAQKALQQICARHDIIFVDITAEVQKADADKAHPSRGFINSRIGFGHLNRYGHQVLADILYQKLKDILK